MRILFFVSTFPALSETFILNQITGCIDAGHEIEIVACQKATNNKYHPDVEKYQLMSKVTFIDIPKSNVRKLIKSIKVLTKYLFHEPKMCLEMLKLNKYGKIVFSLRPLLCIPFFAKEKSWDAIICHYGSNGLIATMCKQKDWVDGKVLTFFHGNDITGFVKKFGMRIYQPLFQSPSLLLPISDLWKNKLLELGGNEVNIKVHHMGVDLDKFNYVPLKFVESNPVKILLVGRLTNKKGIDIAIRSIYELKNKGIKVSLDIIGDGEEKETLLELIRELDLVCDVTLNGWLTQEQVNEEIEKATLIILPSRTAINGDMEGIPVSLMEAMARGKLVISTYHSGIPELIQDKFNGWLVPENNSRLLANKIEEVLNSKESWSNISYQARKTIMDNFNIVKLNQELIRIIQE